MSPTLASSSIHTAVDGTLPPPAWTLRDWVTLISLAAIQFLNILDFIILMPLGPRFLDELGFSTKQFGYVVAIYGYASFAAGILAAGWLNRFDRRNALLVLLGLFMLSTFYCSRAQTFPDLLIARAIAGACGGLMGSLVVSTVSDLFHESRRGFALGIIMSAFAIASIVGVPVGLGLSEQFSSARFPFFVLSMLCIPFGATLWVSLPRADQQGDRTTDGYWRTQWETVKPTSHRWAFVFTVMLVLQSFLVVPYLATYCVKNLGLPEERLPWVYIFGGLCALITSPLVGRLSDRFGKFLVYRWVVGCAIVPTLLITHLTAIPNWACIVLTTLYMAITSSRMVAAQAILSSLPERRWRTSFLSMNGSVQSLSSGLAASFSANIVSEDPTGRLENFWIVGLLGASFFLWSALLLPRLHPSRTRDG
jgi:MFS transporter, DHA1 family, inner membrane transport protein